MKFDSAKPKPALCLTLLPRLIPRSFRFTKPAVIKGQDSYHAHGISMLITWLPRPRCSNIQDQAPSRNPFESPSQIPTAARSSAKNGVYSIQRI